MVASHVRRLPRNSNPATKKAGVFAGPNGNQDAAATFKDGLTALSAYMMFVLHYFENYLTTANLHSWPIISHASLRHLSSRQAFTAAVARLWGEIPGLEVAAVVNFLISRFPPPPSIAIGKREIGLLAKGKQSALAAYVFAWGKKSMPFQKRAYISGNFLYIICQVLHGVPISGTFGGMEQPLKASWGS